MLCQTNGLHTISIYQYGITSQRIDFFENRKPIHDHLLIFAGILITH
jgi:hypothetical protein